ncbi:MAG: hypothetical protein ACJ71Q_17870 [Terriglobales bacterium]
MPKKKNQPKKIFRNTDSEVLRGRKRRVEPSWVVGSAEVYTTQFSLAWDKIGDRLLGAKSAEEVAAALNLAGGSISIPIDRGKFSALVFEIKNDPKFPHARRKSQVCFLADSLGANGVLTPRRSRDVCAEERAKAKRTNYIVRYEYYVECSCGYKGHSQDHACAVCGARIPSDSPDWDQ